MKTIISYVLFFALIALTQSEYLLDNFPGDQQLVIISGTGPSGPVFSSQENNAVLGGERDLILSITSSASASRVATAQVLNKQLSQSNPSDISTSLIIQYDGADNSTDLDKTGLGGLDFLTLSPKQSFSLDSRVDTSFATIEILVTDMDGGQSTAVINVAQSTSLTTYTVAFSQFTGNVDFSNVGAVQLELSLASNIDLIVEHFILNDNTANPSVSVTPSPRPVKASSTPSKRPQNNSSSSTSFSSFSSSSFSSTSFSSFFSSFSSSSGSNSSSGASSVLGQLYLPLFIAALLFSLF